mmetsp:Transcript_19573/g.67182  ORF Transcript_19573/g.67182 Transcript_19573/m.67182 type:complete len:423 (+) Transcript_19573:109-1377(+)
MSNKLRSEFSQSARLADVVAALVERQDRVRERLYALDLLTQDEQVRDIDDPDSARPAKPPFLGARLSGAAAKVVSFRGGSDGSKPALNSAQGSATPLQPRPPAKGSANKAALRRAPSFGRAMSFGRGTCMFDDAEEASSAPADETSQLDELLRLHRRGRSENGRLDVSQRFQLSQNVAKLVGPPAQSEPTAAKSLWGLEVALREADAPAWFEHDRQLRHTNDGAAATLLGAAARRVRGMPTVLVAALDAGLRNFVRSTFERVGCLVDQETRATLANARMRTHDYDVVVFGQRLAKRMTGLAAARRHRNAQAAAGFKPDADTTGPQQPCWPTLSAGEATGAHRRPTAMCVLMEGPPSAVQADEARRLGVVLLEPPCTVSQLLAVSPHFDYHIQLLDAERAEANRPPTPEAVEPPRAYGFDPFS